MGSRVSDVMMRRPGPAVEDLSLSTPVDLTVAARTELEERCQALSAGAMALRMWASQEPEELTLATAMLVRELIDHSARIRHLVQVGVSHSGRGHEQ